MGVAEDRDELHGIFDEYQTNVLLLYSEYNRLKRLCIDSKEQLNICFEKEKQLSKENVILQELLKSCQEMISKRIDLEDENVKIKECLQLTKEKLLNTEMESTETVNSLQNELKQLKEKHTEELSRIKLAHENSIEQLTLSYQQELDNKSEQLRLSEDNIDQLKADFQADFSKYKSEMEDKILKLQPNNFVGSLSENQDIFRKKLLHEKQESDKEKAGLKRKIQDLENLLNTLQTRKSGPQSKMTRK